MALHEQALADHYDGYYVSGPSAWRALGARDKAANIEALWGREPANVIEIGCGDGSVLERLQRGGWRAVGVDVSSSGVEVSVGRGLDARVYDGRTVPFADKSFDVAVLSHVVEHLEHPRIVLAEASRVARYVIVEVPLEYSIRTPAHHEWNDVGHINLYSMKLIRHLVESVGLVVERETVTNHSREVSVHQRGVLRGSAVWVLREAALRASRRIAPHVFVYNGALLCRCP